MPAAQFKPHIMDKLVTLQQRLDANAKAKCEREVKAAFDQLQKSLSTAGVYYDEIPISVWDHASHKTLELKLRPDGLMIELVRAFIKHGEVNYLAEETAEFLQKVTSLQDQIDSLPRE